MNNPKNLSFSSHSREPHSPFYMVAAFSFIFIINFRGSTSNYEMIIKCYTLVLFSKLKSILTRELLLAKHRGTAVCVRCAVNTYKNVFDGPCVRVCVCVCVCWLSGSVE